MDKTFSLWKKKYLLISSESPSLINNDLRIIDEIKGGQIVIFKNNNNKISVNNYNYDNKFKNRVF